MPVGPSRRHRSGRNLMFAIGCCTFALVIWAKLKLVTTLPKTAIADPALVQVAPASPTAPAPVAEAPVETGVSPGAE